MFYAYVLRSRKNPERFYFGFTADLRERVAAHNRGENRATQSARPWDVAWYGAFETEEAARAFEGYLKTASGKAFARKRLLVGV